MPVLHDVAHGITEFISRRCTNITDLIRAKRRDINDSSDKDHDDSERDHDNDDNEDNENEDEDMEEKKDVAT